MRKPEDKTIGDYYDREYPEAMLDAMETGPEECRKSIKNRLDAKKCDITDHDAVAIQGFCNFVERASADGVKP